MIFELLNRFFHAILKLIGIGFVGFSDFESEENCRKKVNESFINKKNDSALPIFDGSLSDACKLSEESNGLLLLIFLNPRNGDSLQFHHSVLDNSEFHSKLNEVNFKTPMLVLFDVTNHYHFKVSRALGVTSYPALAIKTKLQDKFQTVLCYEGFLNVDGIMSLIQSVLLTVEAEIAQAAEISSMRAIQNEQNEAYLRSLEIDKEKLHRKKLQQSQEQFNKRDISKVAKVNDDSDIYDVIEQKSDALAVRISQALLDMKDEPEVGTSGVFKFQFLFPDGTRKIRTFAGSSTIKNLFDFVFGCGVELRSEKVAIRSIEPRLEILEEETKCDAKLSEFPEIVSGIKLFVDYI